MAQARPGVRFRETMSGGFALGATEPRDGERRGDAEGTRLAMHATIDIRDLDRFIEDPEHAGDIDGRVDFTPFAEGIAAKGGVFNLFSSSESPDLKLMVYELAFDWDGGEYYLAGRKEVRNDPGFDLWTDTTTLFARLHRGNDASGEVVGAGVLTLGTDDLMRMIPTIRVTNGGSAVAQAATLVRFGRFFMGELWDRYAPDLSWWQRLLRMLRLR